MEVGSQKWFEERAKKSLKKIEDGLWDFSDSALAYSPESMKAYATAQQENDAKYKDKVTNKESEFLKFIAPQIVSDLPETFAFIDLGPGTEHKEQFFFDAVKNQGKQITYIPVDVSNEVLADVKNFAEEQGFKVQELYTTFEELPNVLEETGYRFVSLGLTVINYELPEILGLLRKIIGNSGGAFVTLQVRDRVNIQEIRNTYCTKQLLSMWHGKLSLIGVLPEEIEIETTDDVLIKGVVKEVNEQTSKLDLKVGDSIIIHKSYRHTIEGFLRQAKKLFKCKVYDNGNEFVGILMEM